MNCENCRYKKMCVRRFHPMGDTYNCKYYEEYEQSPHGYWKKIDTTVMCSVCEHGWGKGHAPKDLEDYNFCPNCGASMRKEGDGCDGKRTQE